MRTAYLLFTGTVTVNWHDDDDEDDAPLVRVGGRDVLGETLASLPSSTDGARAARWARFGDWNGPLAEGLVEARRVSGVSYGGCYCCGGDDPAEAVLNVGSVDVLDHLTARVGQHVTCWLSAELLPDVDPRHPVYDPPVQVTIAHPLRVASGTYYPPGSPVVIGKRWATSLAATGVVLARGTALVHVPVDTPKEKERRP